MREGGVGQLARSIERTSAEQIAVLKAWIGAGAIVLGHRGVSIGENAVVAAHTVLTKDLPAYCMAIGNPARIIKR